MRLTFTIFCSLFLTTFVSGQTTFSKLYWNYPYTTLGLSIALDTNSIYVTGRGASFIEAYLIPNKFFLKTDLNGNQILSKNIEGNLYYTWREGYAGGFEFLSSQTIIVAGYKSKYDTLFPPMNSEHLGIIYKYNLNGDTLYTKQFIGDGYTEFAQLIYDSVLNRIYAGHATRDTLLSVAKAYLVCTDTAGNIIWDQKEGNDYHVELAGLLEFFKNSGVISSGIVFNDGADNLGNGKFYKTDLNGNAYFSKVIGTTGYDSEIQVKVAKNQKSFIVRQYLDTVINAGDDPYVSYIGKMDTSGNFIWRTFLNDVYFKYFYTLRTFDDGSIVAVGHKIVDDSYITNGYIIKLDSNGTVLWERDYTEYPTSEHYFYDFRQMPDKGYVISGMGVKEIDDVAQSMMWLVRLDSMGCLIPGCDGTPIIDPINNANTVFTIYPNPVSNTSTVEITIPTNFTIIPGEELQLNIYDITGKLFDRYANIYVQNQGEVIRFNIYKKNLAAGIYEAVLTYGAVNLGNVKLQIIN